MYVFEINRIDYNNILDDILVYYYISKHTLKWMVVFNQQLTQFF